MTEPNSKTLRLARRQSLPNQVMRLIFLPLMVTICAAVPMDRLPLVLSLTEGDDSTSTDRGVPTASPVMAAGETGVAVTFPEGLTGVRIGILSLTLVPTGKTDLACNSGRVLRAARIIAIGETIVSVADAEGLTGVPIESVPFDVLERAQTEITAAAAQRKQKEAEEAARERDRERAAESEARKAMELQARLGTVNARADTLLRDPTSRPERQAMNPPEKLLALKAKFPARKSAKNDLGIEFDVPARQVWSFYYATFQATAVDALPDTLAIMEARLVQDIAAWQWKSRITESLRQSGEHLQAERTVIWLSRTLRGFLDEARQVARGK